MFKCVTQAAYDQRFQVGYHLNPIWTGGGNDPLRVFAKYLKNGLANLHETLWLLKCIYHLWRNSVQRPPVCSKDHMQKISGIGIVVFPQLSFFSFEKSQNYDVTWGTHIKALYGRKQWKRQYLTE